MNNIGFMQGRLSPMVDGAIQAFPQKFWKDEFRFARENGLDLMEWTLDSDQLHKNPFMTPDGREEILEHSETNGVKIESVTGDCFMQAPFYKFIGKERSALLDSAEKILEASIELSIHYVILPLVDSGRIEENWQEEALLEGLDGLNHLLREGSIMVLFESDYPPLKLKSFISSFSQNEIGINYDIGNSANLGYDPEEEIMAYGNRIFNVHVKDRALGGTTVPLGEGNADIPGVLNLLMKSGYNGNFILQTVRATDGKDVKVLCHYRDILQNWLMEIA
ncbi:sugar phosphate isomerase/epimerase [Candidatus Marinimicrobia bacterium MT.SAG.4]|nr:sugar phosphate isomerase/epimerase [Candidatus Marinimicrobia bacterium MT.SAG.4]